MVKRRMAYGWWRGGWVVKRRMVGGEEEDRGW